MLRQLKPHAKHAVLHIPLELHRAVTRDVASGAELADTRRLRILVLGPLGSLHVEHMAMAAQDHGHDVVVGGAPWTGMPAAPLIDDRIVVSHPTWPTARWMHRLLRATRPDLVHAHWMPYAALAMLYGASPVIVSAWGSDVLRASRLQRIAWRLVVRYADMLLASSGALVDELHELGAPAERTQLVNWGVDLRAFSPPTADREVLRAALDLPPGPMIISPRSDNEIYNADIILRAFERVARERSDVTLVLLRTPAEGKDLGPLRHPERVRKIGRVPYERMQDYYRAADVCVSIASSDSSPRSVWESMACGTPCVVSDIPWVHELITDQEHALIVSIDEESVAAATRRLLDDRPLAARISAEARRLVEQERDHDREMKRLFAIYEQVVREGGRRSRLPRVLSPAAVAVGIVQAVVRRVLARLRNR